MKFDYSLELCRELNSNISGNNEAWSILMSNIEKFLKERNFNFKKSDEIIKQYSKSINYDFDGLRLTIDYSGSDKDGSLSLYMQMCNHHLPEEIFKDAYENKQMFGLPLFHMNRVIDNMDPFFPAGYRDMLFLFFMSPDQLKKLDTPQEQEFRRIMNELDERFG